MDIQNALLSMLSVKPMTGYDLKKAMQESAYMHWSGNNNQIYKALLALQEEGPGCMPKPIIRKARPPRRSIRLRRRAGRF